MKEKWAAGRFLPVLMCVLVALVLTGCPNRNRPVRVDGVEIYRGADRVTGTTIDAQAGGANVQLRAVVHPADADDNHVTWSSGNVNVVTVTNNGLVSIAGAGSTYVRVVTRDGDREARVNFAVTHADTWNIGISQLTPHVFPLIEGYTQVTPLQVTITNTGNQPTGQLTVALSTTSASDFVLAPVGGTAMAAGASLTIGSIEAANGTAQFTVAPRIGLPLNSSVAATVTVSAAAAELTATPSFNVSVNVSLDTGPLDGLIDEAEALLEDTPESEDGTDVAEDSYWATQADRAALEQAIYDAQTALTDATTQAELVTAYDNLSTALETFNGVRQQGVLTLTGGISISIRDFYDRGQRDLVNDISGAISRSGGIVFEYDGLEFYMWLWGDGEYSTDPRLELDLPVGSHSVTLVVDIDGDFYSMSITFRVVE